jgi:hypothetical protein
VRTDLKLFPAFLAALLGVVSLSWAAPVETIPFDEIRTGMTGTGLTVFSGTEITEFQVEILGVLPGIGPDQDLILARCSGGTLERTGVLAGMSGSPVYIDGRLAGAVAFAWGFSKEPIAGITPIGQMLELRRDTAGGGLNGDLSGRAGRTPFQTEWTEVLRDTGSMTSFFQNRLSQFDHRSSFLPTHLPLAISGLGRAGFDAIAGDLSSGGFLPMQAGSSGSVGDKTTASDRGATLEPGSAIGVKLVRGDVEMSATGTVTWVDGNEVLAFGHPLFGLGHVDLPMTTARVEALLPSLQVSSRMARTTEEVGSLRLDRPSGIFGLTGEQPRMIPVRLQYVEKSGRRTYSFDVADDPNLAPVLVFYALNGILASRDRPGGNSTLRVARGSVIKLQDRDDVILDNLFAGGNSQFFSSGTTAYILHLLMNNEWGSPRIEGVNLILEHDPEIRTGRVTGLTLDRYVVRPGETVQATVTVTPWRGSEKILTRDLVIPPQTGPGKIQVRASGVMAILLEDGAGDQVVPYRLNQFIRLINNLRKNDRVFISAGRHETVLDLQGSFLPNLPPSTMAILSTIDGSGRRSRKLRRSLADTAIPVEFEVHGLARAVLEVVAP